MWLRSVKVGWARVIAIITSNLTLVSYYLALRGLYLLLAYTY